MILKCTFANLVRTNHYLNIALMYIFLITAKLKNFFYICFLFVDTFKSKLGNWEWLFLAKIKYSAVEITQDLEAHISFQTRQARDPNVALLCPSHLTLAHCKIGRQLPHVVALRTKGDKLCWWFSAGVFMRITSNAVKLLKPDLTPGQMSQKLKGQDPGLCMLFKSTGSDCPSLWDHFCFTLLGKHPQATQQHPTRSQSPPCFLLAEETEAQTLPASSALPSLLHCGHVDWADWLPVLSPQGHGPSKHPLSLAHQFLPVPLPDHSHQLTKPCGHIIYLHTDTHTHSFLLSHASLVSTLFLFPFMAKLLSNGLYLLPATPLPFSARSETTLFPSTRVNTCLFLPDLSRAHHALRKACSSLSFQVNSLLWFLFYQGDVSFLSPSESIISSSWPLSTVAPRVTCS